MESLTAWRTFLAVCRLGSLSAAADELGYTQSAVSRQVAGLERDLRTSLLERHARGVRPTPAGEAFCGHAGVAVDEVDRAIRSARRAGAGVHRSLVVGATPSLAAGIVPAAVRDLLDELPAGTGCEDGDAPRSAGGAGSLAWRLVPALSAALQPQVASGELDLAVVTDAPPGLPDDPRLRRRRLGTDEMVVVVPAGHPRAGGPPVSVAAFEDETWAEDNAGSAALLRQHAGRAGVAVRIGLAAADLPGKVALVATRHAIALVPGVLAASLRPDVAVVRLVDAPTRAIHAVVPRHAPHPLASRLLDRLEAALAPA